MTMDKTQAKRLIAALNEPGNQAALILSLARIYLKHSDPIMGQRTWQHVLAAGIGFKRWGASATCESTHSSKVIGVMPSLRELGRNRWGS